MAKKKDIVIPEWLSEKKDGLGPRIKEWEKVRETEKAILIEANGEEYWLPKHYVTYDEFETHTLDEY